MKVEVRCIKCRALLCKMLFGKVEIKCRSCGETHEYEVSRAKDLYAELLARA